MKLIFANPATGQQKTFDIDDETRTRIFYEKRISQEVSIDSLGDEFKGYVVRVSGGNDKQGFPLKQGVLVPHRVRLLLAKGHSCYRPRKAGERKRKSVRGCIVSSEVRALHLVVVKQGDADIAGLTDEVLPKRLGPKRATKIRSFFNLDKEDDVRKFVIRREIEKNGKTISKAPKIQRLVTPERLQRKRHIRAVKASKIEHSKKQAADYKLLIAKRTAEKRARDKAIKSEKKALKA